MDNTGGGPLFGETTKSALRRHIKEKCGFEIEIECLLWISELFFFNVEHDRDIHGNGLYYLVSPTEVDGNWQQDEFLGTKHSDRIYKWFRLDELGDVNLRLVCLKQSLSQIPNNTEHIVCRED